VQVTRDQPPLGIGESQGAGGLQLEMDDPDTRQAPAGREVWVAEL
jgi:hypothetical protein